MRHFCKWTPLAEHPWTSDGRLLTPGAISRLLRANHAVGSDQPTEFEQVMEVALDRLSTQWGVEL